MGASGSGKTAYGIQFLREGILAGDHCIYINCSQAVTEESFNNYFTMGTKFPKYISLFSRQASGPSLSDLLERIRIMLQTSETMKRVVLDSITDINARFPNEAVQKFVAELYDLLKDNNAVGLLTINGSSSVSTIDTLGSPVDGIIQLRMDDSADKVQRSIRLFSIKT